MSDKPDVGAIHELLRSGELIEAENACAKALQEAPGDRQLIHLRALIKDRAGQHSSAIASLRELLDYESDYVEAYIDLGSMLHRAGHLIESRQCYSHALDCGNRHPLLHYNLGMLLREEGDQEGAIKQLSLALEEKPDYFDALLAMANTLRDSNRPEEALEIYRRAEALSPSNALLQAELGLTLHLMRDDPAAERCLLNALDENPGLVIGWLRLAIVRRRMGKINEAIAHNKKVLELLPGCTEAHNNLALCYIDLMRWKQALASLDCVLEQKPDSVEALSNKSSLFIQLGRFDSAVEQLDLILDKHPDNVNAMQSKALVLRKSGRVDEARSVIESLLSMDRAHPGAKVLLATLFQFDGDYPAAQALAREVLGESPEDSACVDAYFLLAKTGADLSADDIATMQGISERTGLKHNERASILFALADALEAKGEHIRAFQRLEEANKEASAGHYYNPDRTSRMMLRVTRTFPASMFNSLIDHSRHSLKPVFVVGMPRSGTTLLEQMLSRHSQIFAAGELYDIGLLADETFHAIDGEPGKFTINRNQLAKLADRYIGALREISGGAEYVTDKMPQNFVQLGFIKLLFPDARIVHCRRDPVATCFSIYKSHFTSGHYYAYNLDHLARYYRDYLKLMNHWYAAFGDDMFTVDYEKLVANPEPVMRSLLAYCGLQFEEDCLSPEGAVRPVTTASHMQVRQPIYSGASDKWRRYERQLEPLVRGLED